MKSKTLIAIIAGMVTFSWQSEAQSYDTNGAVVQTFAGSGFYGYLDGQGTQTMFNSPSAVVADSTGNLYVADNGNFRIRKISPTGAVSTFAGGGTLSIGYGTNVLLTSYAFASMAIDRSNSLWIVTGGSGELLRIGSDSFVSRTNLAGVGAFSGVCVDSQNNIYYSDPPGNRIYRYMTNGVLEVFVGSGNSGSTDGNGIFTSFNYPRALAADAADNIYVWDSANSLIRKIDQSRNVVTLAGVIGSPYSNSDGVGMSISFSGVFGLCVDSFGNLILASSYAGGGPQACIRKMTVTTNATTIAGSFTQAGYTNGAGALARFRKPTGVCTFQGTIFVADFDDHRIRSITNNPTAQTVLPTNLHLNTYPGLQIVGTLGRTYQIQSSPDMTNWTTRATLLLTSSPYLWFDQNPVSGNKFYRALLLP